MRDRRTVDDLLAEQEPTQEGIGLDEDTLDEATAVAATEKTLENLKSNDLLILYHGTHLKGFEEMVDGVDATEVHYRQYGGPRHAGIFVSPTYEYAKEWASYGKIVLELALRTKNLHGTNWSGDMWTKKEEEGFREFHPNSFRPGITYSLLQKGRETQVLYVGMIKPKHIRAVWLEGKRLTLDEAVKQLSLRRYGVDMTSTNLSLGQFLEAYKRHNKFDDRDAKSFGSSKYKTASGWFFWKANSFLKHGFNRLVEVLHHPYEGFSIGMPEKAARALAQKIAKALQQVKDGGFDALGASTLRESYEDVGFVGKYWGSAGSGLLFTTGEAVLLLKRSVAVEEPGTWGIPGGAIPKENGRLMDALVSARKEGEEEVGRLPRFKVVDKYVFKDGSFKFTTFVARVDREFTPQINWESDAYAWVNHEDTFKYRLHPGVVALLKHVNPFEKNMHEAKTDPFYQKILNKRIDWSKIETSKLSLRERLIEPMRFGPPTNGVEFKKGYIRANFKYADHQLAGLYQRWWNLKRVGAAITELNFCSTTVNYPSGKLVDQSDPGVNGVYVKFRENVPLTKTVQEEILELVEASGDLRADILRLFKEVTRKYFSHVPSSPPPKIVIKSNMTGGRLADYVPPPKNTMTFDADAALNPELLKSLCWHEAIHYYEWFDSFREHGERMAAKLWALSSRFDGGHANYFKDKMAQINRGEGTDLIHIKSPTVKLDATKPFGLYIFLLPGWRNRYGVCWSASYDPKIAAKLKEKFETARAHGSVQVWATTSTDGWLKKSVKRISINTIKGSRWPAIEPSDPDFHRIEPIIKPANLVEAVDKTRSEEFKRDGSNFFRIAEKVPFNQVGKKSLKESVYGKPNKMGRFLLLDGKRFVEFGEGTHSRWLNKHESKAKFALSAMYGCFENEISFNEKMPKRYLDQIYSSFWKAGGAAKPREEVTDSLYLNTKKMGWVEIFASNFLEQKNYVVCYGEFESHAFKGDYLPRQIAKLVPTKFLARQFKAALDKYRADLKKQPRAALREDDDHLDEARLKKIGVYILGIKGKPNEFALCWSNRYIPNIAITLKRAFKAVEGDGRAWAGESSEMALRAMPQVTPRTNIDKASLHTIKRGEPAFRLIKSLLTPEHKVIQNQVIFREDDDDNGFPVGELADAERLDALVRRMRVHRKAGHLGEAKVEARVGLNELMHLTEETPRKEPLSEPGITQIWLDVGGTCLRVWLANEGDERDLGLMRVQDLPPGTGMWFTYPQAKKLTFWMKNTPLPLDLAFVGTNGRITEIRQLRAFDTAPVTSLTPVVAALEVEAGWFEQHDVEVGAQITEADAPNEDYATVDDLLVERDVGRTVPNKFYLVFNIPSLGNDSEKWIKEIRAGRMTGVIGVSGDPRIVPQFGYRGGLLVMNGTEFVKLNKLSRLQYDNPHYLVQDNLEALYRIFDKKRNSSSGPRGVIFNVGQSLQAESSGRFQYSAKHGAMHQTVADYYQKHLHRFKGLDDLANWLYDAYVKLFTEQKFDRWATMKDEVSRAEFKGWLLKGLAQIGNLYSDEGEWIIKDRDLKIPKSSRIYWLIERVFLDQIKRVPQMTDLEKRQAVTFRNDYIIRTAEQIERARKQLRGYDFEVVKKEGFKP